MSFSWPLKKHIPLILGFFCGWTSSGQLVGGRVRMPGPRQGNLNARGFATCDLFSFCFSRDDAYNPFFGARQLNPLIQRNTNPLGLNWGFPEASVSLRLRPLQPLAVDINRWVLSPSEGV